MRGSREVSALNADDLGLNLWPSDTSDLNNGELVPDMPDT